MSSRLAFIQCTYDSDPLDLTLMQNSSSRYLHPNLTELVLMKIDCITQITASTNFTSLIFPFLQLTRLEIIECDFPFPANEEEKENSIFQRIVDDLATSFQQLQVLRWDDKG